MKIIETKRLYLREMLIDDAENIYRLNIDWENIKYTGDKPFKNIQEAKDFLSSYTHYKDHGLGRWAVVEKDTNEFLGWCGLKYTPKLNEYDIGFRLFKEYWNKGIANEEAKAYIEYGFSEIGLTLIVGRSMKENNSSIRVLEKIGLVYFSQFDFEGESGGYYEVSNTNFNTICI